MFALILTVALVLVVVAIYAIFRNDSKLFARECDHHARTQAVEARRASAGYPPLPTRR